MTQKAAVVLSSVLQPVLQGAGERATLKGQQEATFPVSIDDFSPGEGSTSWGALTHSVYTLYDPPISCLQPPATAEKPGTGLQTFGLTQEGRRRLQIVCTSFAPL